MSAVMEEKNSSEGELLEKLADALAKHFRHVIPIEKDLWDVSMVASYLKRDPQSVRERITCLPDFPRAIRLPAQKGRAHPLYKAKEIIEWADKYQEKR